MPLWPTCEASFCISLLPSFTLFIFSGPLAVLLHPHPNYLQTLTPDSLTFSGSWRRCLTTTWATPRSLLWPRGSMQPSKLLSTCSGLLWSPGSSTSGIRGAPYKTIPFPSHVARVISFDAMHGLPSQILREQRGWGRFLQLHSHTFPVFQHSNGQTAGWGSEDKGKLKACAQNLCLFYFLQVKWMWKLCSLYIKVKWSRSVWTL